MSFKIPFMHIAFVTDVTLIARHVAEISQEIMKKSATLYFKLTTVDNVRYSRAEYAIFNLLC